MAICFDLGYEQAGVILLAPRFAMLHSLQGRALRVSCRAATLVGARALRRYAGRGSPRSN